MIAVREFARMVQARQVESRCPSWRSNYAANDAGFGSGVRHLCEVTCIWAQKYGR